jgi:hypothetical protein
MLGFADGPSRVIDKSMLQGLPLFSESRRFRRRQGADFGRSLRFRFALVRMTDQNARVAIIRKTAAAIAAHG